MNVLSGLLASVVLVTALNLTGGNSEKYFTAGLALVISTTFISYLLTFPSMLVLRRKMPDTPRPFRAPLAVLTTVLTTGLVAFTVVVLIWPLDLPSAFAGERTAVHAVAGDPAADRDRYRVPVLRLGRADARLGP